MQPVERIEITKPIESKWIRADELWNKISGNAFFSTDEKLKIRLAIETEPEEDVKPVKYTSWYVDHELYTHGECQCLSCGAILDYDMIDYDYCPKCGAEVINPEEEEEYEKAIVTQEERITNKHETD